MHELEAIILANEKSRQKGETTFLATIVNTVGSTYRQKGAKMLIHETGEMVGTLSGGCVENDIFQYTQRIIQEPLIIEYDATKVEEDLIWGFGLGCNGAVTILLEKLNQPDILSPLNLISQCLKKKEIGAIATIFSITREIDLKIGARFVLYPDDTTDTDIQNRTLVEAIAHDTIRAKASQKSTVNQYQLPSGSIDVFIDVIHPPRSLIVFGAGRDALPVVTLAKAIGWQVTVVDCRALPETYQRFAIADEIILTRRDILNRQLSINENTAAVVMTHNYLDDFEIIKWLLPTPIPYLGVMGSKNRIANIMKQLNPTSAQLKKVYSPVGLDIGADTPAEIATAIVAEIQAVLAKRNGGFSKHRHQPLHVRDDIQYKPISSSEKVKILEYK
ncbi:MAG: XdhC family protein [Leptolyngbya sp. SIO1E4]|nr:XdhC family protein [Leptolyngbya sp. SIO1E4]